MQEDNFDKDSFDDDEEIDVYTLTDEEGNDEDYELLGRLDEDGQTYVALAPMDEAEGGDGEEEDTFIILKVVEENGEEIFEAIEDDDEFDRIADIFEDELMQDLDYDSEDDEEDEEDDEDGED
ncbi:MAG: DUF1292 domain-containing protein [Oscillospiraceae bacterium]|nr:DUF1292 domain-containing protein [Oscillospiraceae bacterium]